MSVQTATKSLSFSTKFGGSFQSFRGSIVCPFYNTDWLNKISCLSTSSQDIMITSYFKTGTHWMKKILLEIMKANKHTSKCERYNTINLSNFGVINNFDGIYGGNEEVDDELIKWDKYVNETNDGYPRIYHSHLNYDIISEMNIHSNTKIISLYRNPKAVATSLHNMAFNLPGFQYTGTMDDSLYLFLCGLAFNGDYWDHVLNWHLNHKNINNILYICYEDLITNFDSNLDRICNHINIDISESDKKIIKNKSMFSNMKQEYIDNPGNLYEYLGLSTDAFINKGKIDTYKEYFNDEMSHYYDCKTLVKWEQIPDILYYKELCT